MQYLSEILYLLGSNKRKLLLMLFLFLFLSFLDLIGIGLIGPYIALVVNENLATEGYFYDLIVFFNLPLDRQELLSSTGFILISLFLLKSILAIFINKHIVQFSNNQKAYLQEFLMKSYQDMDYSHYIRRNSSEYIQSIQGYVDNYRGVLLTGLRVVSDSLMAAAILLMLVMISPISVLMLILLIGISGFSYDSFFRNKVPIYGKRINEAKIKIIRGTYEGIKGFKEVKILGKEGYFYNLVSEGAALQSQNDTKSQVITTAPRYLLELIMVSFVVFMVFFSSSSSSWIGIEQGDILPVLSMFGVAALRLIPSANIILSSVVQFRINRHAISKLYLDLKVLKKHQINNTSDKLPTSLKPDTFNKFSIDDVCYSYPGQKNMTLNKINIKIEKGDTIGIIGSSGSGKTTLIDVILGLLKPQSGQVKYNDNDIFKSLKDWQSQIAYLPQQVFLVDGTLRNNVALGVDDKDIDDMQMQLSIEKSRLSKLVQSLPGGMDTHIGEDGIKLSGGQRQRVALARAFYHKREILIMDESTSALDSESEQEIIKELKALKRDKTIIIISHSLNIIKDCDCIYKLSNGKVIDYGKYGEIFN